MKRTTITISLIGAEPRQIAASVEDTGSFAVHQTVGAERGWYSVTHVPTGYCLTTWRGREDAIRIANLAAACGDIFTAQGVREMDTDAYRALRKAVFDVEH